MCVCVCLCSLGKGESGVELTCSTIVYMCDVTDIVNPRGRSDATLPGVWSHVSSERLMSLASCRLHFSL